MAFAAATLRPAGAVALDYDRNDVRVRDLGLIIGVLPVQGRPIGVGVRGAARRQTRNLSLGTEVLIGGTSAGRPWVGAAALLGAETSDNGWDRLRGYGEFGFGLAWASSNALDLLHFHLEAGTRILVLDAARPHLSLSVGARVSTNFGGIGAGVVLSMSWAFD